MAPTVIRFTSINYQRVTDRSDCVIVLCDCDRPLGLPTLVGHRVDIDGEIYRVVGADDLARPLFEGEEIVLWVEAVGVAKNTTGRGRRWC